MPPDDFEIAMLALRTLVGLDVISVDAASEVEAEIRRRYE